MDFRELVDSLPGLVWSARPDGQTDYLNRRWQEYTGLSSANAVADGWLAAVHPVDVPEISSYWMDRLREGEPGEIEARLRRHDGDYRRFLVAAAPLRDPEGKIRRWCGINTDIEERWRTEYRQAVRQITVAQELSATGSFTADVWADEHDWSEELYRIFGIPVGTRISVLDIERMIVEEDRAAFRDGFANAVATRTRYSEGFRIVTPSGELKFLQSNAQYSGEIAGRPLYIGAIQDVSQNKLYEMTLRDREADLHRINSLLLQAEHVSQTGSFMFDVVEQRGTWSNEAFRIFGLPPQPSITLAEIERHVLPEDVDAVNHALQRAISGSENIETSFRIKRSDGELRHLRCLARSTDEGSDKRYFVGAIQDVTERKVVEEALDRARGELAHLARLTALSTLTAAIAHEVNQPLAGIVTNASTCLRMLAAEPPDLEGARATAQRTIRDGRRASEIIQRLRLMFARKPADFEPFDLQGAIEEVLSLTATEIRRLRISLNTDFTSGLPPVRGDRVQVQQVVLNLVLNAMDACSGLADQRRMIEVGVRLFDEAHVEVMIADAGTGLSEEVRQRLFEPFFTTKSNGMGIGLSVSQNILESHGGRLWANRNEPEGARFHFCIPVAPENGAGELTDVGDRTGDA